MLHIIICRSRTGWAVNLEADRLCDHTSAEAARRSAVGMLPFAVDEDGPAVLVDLTPGGDAYRTRPPM